MTRRRLFLAAFAAGCVLSGVALGATDSAVVVLIYEQGMS